MGFIRWMAWTGLAGVVAMAAGCGTTATEQDLVCAGQERVYTEGADAVPPKSQRVSLPVRLSDERVWVKSITGRRWATEDGMQHYEAKWRDGWQVAQFNPASLQLHLIGESNQVAAGLSQVVRTTGVYQCVVSPGPWLRSAT